MRAGGAGIALEALRAIEMVATAPKTHLGQIGINLHIHRLTGVEEQRGGLFVRQVAASVRLSGIKLQTRQLGHDEPSGNL